MNIWITYRYKDSFFLDPETAERGRQALVQVVEAEYEALGGNNNVQVEVGEEPDAEEGSSSILQSMRKRICRDRERHVEVTMILLASQSDAHTIAPHRDPIQSHTHPSIHI